MRLASDILVTLDGASWRLRASLRAAYNLENRFGGFAPLTRSILEGSITTISAVIVECVANELRHSVVANAIIGHGIHRALDEITGPLLQLVTALAGMDDEDAKPAKGKASKAKPITYREHFEKLFGLATGVLGWSPSDAWDATPAEITIALRAKFPEAADKAGSGLKLSDKFRALAAKHGAAPMGSE